MILLDTNVLSELWKIIPEKRVLDWIDAQPIETLYLSSITLAELRLGIAIMPEGKRKTTYTRRLEEEVLPVFQGNILPFDLNASVHYARLMRNARKDGKAIGKEDGYIAAIAASKKFIVATRDVSPYEAAGLEVINPWQF